MKFIATALFALLVLGAPSPVPIWAEEGAGETGGETRFLVEGANELTEGLYLHGTAEKGSISRVNGVGSFRYGYLRQGASEKLEIGWALSYHYDETRHRIAPYQQAPPFLLVTDRRFHIWEGTLTLPFFAEPLEDAALRNFEVQLEVGAKWRVSPIPASLFLAKTHVMIYIVGDGLPSSARDLLLRNLEERRAFTAAVQTGLVRIVEGTEVPRYDSIEPYFQPVIEIPLNLYEIDGVPVEDIK